MTLTASNTVPKTTATQTGTALVTGAARGIGRAIALRLAADGYDVAVNDFSNTPDLQSLVEEIKAMDRKSHAFPGDVSSENVVREMIGGVVKEFGGIDVMVANAGVTLIKSLFDTTLNDWNRVIQINAQSIFLAYKYAGMEMVKQGRGGRIIAASSGAGVKAMPMTAGYSASKAAVRALTQAAAMELGQHGITVNAYCPGAIMTPMLQDMDDVQAAEGVTTAGATLDGFAQKAPIGRLGTPEDVAHLVSYFASKQASFMTGQTILIDGGLV